MVHVEAELFGVEGLGPVHVGDRDHDDFECPVHMKEDRAGRPN
jgi:hypothetical protein